jgi:hypothetical protein
MLILGPDPDDAPSMLALVHQGIDHRIGSNKKGAP